MRVLLLTNLIYACVLPVIVGAYIMRNMQDVKMVVRTRPFCGRRLGKRGAV